MDPKEAERVGYDLASSTELMEWIGCAQYNPDYFESLTISIW